MCLSDCGGVSVSLSPRPLPVGGGRSCGGRDTERSDRARPGVGAGDPDSGRGFGGDPSLGGRGLAGSAPLGSGWSCLRPRMGWESGRSHLEPARVVPAARLGAGSPRPQSATLPPELRLPGKQAWAAPREDRGPLVWGGGVRATPACPRPAPPRSLKAGAAPGSCAQVDPGLSSCSLASLGVGDNVDWRHPLFTARPGSPPGQLGFRRS